MPPISSTTISVFFNDWLCLAADVAAAAFFCLLHVALDVLFVVVAPTADFVPFNLMRKIFVPIVGTECDTVVIEPDVCKLLSK